MMAVPLPDRLDIEDAQAALPVLLAKIKAGSGAVEVDAGALVRFDSAAIATLLELRRAAHASGRELSVKGAPQAMVDLATLYGVAELLALSPRAGADPTKPD